MSAHIRKASVILACLAVLMPAAYFRQRSFGKPPRRLYKVRDTRGRLGFIDKTGKVIIGFDQLPAHAVVGDFSEGLAVICLPDEKSGSCRGLGFIDETGKIVIQPRFKLGGNFSEGLAYVETEEMRGFINQRGELVINLKEKAGWGGEFHEGLAAVSTSLGWGFIDHSGKLVTKERYTFADNFSEGLAAVAVGRGEQARYGFINQKGEMVIPLRFEPQLDHHKFVSSLTHFSEGLAKVKVGKLYGYINRQGELVIESKFSLAGDFSEGLASVQTESGEWGYIDKSGRLIISLRDGQGGSFKEGLAAVAFWHDGGAKYGYVDRTGKIIIEPRFNGAFEFADGVAEVYVVNAASALGKSGYIDRTGKYIWEPQ